MALVGGHMKGGTIKWNMVLLSIISLWSTPIWAQKGDLQVISTVFRLGIFANEKHKNQYYIDWERAPKAVVNMKKEWVDCENADDYYPYEVLKDPKSGRCFYETLESQELFYKYWLCPLIKDPAQTSEERSKPLWIVYKTKEATGDKTKYKFNYARLDGSAQTKEKYECKLVGDDVYYAADDSFQRVLETDDVMLPFAFLVQFGGLHALVRGAVVAGATRGASMLMTRFLPATRFWTYGSYVFTLTLQPGFYYVGDKIGKYIENKWTLNKPWDLDKNLEPSLWNVGSMEFQGNTRSYTNLEVLKGDLSVFGSGGVAQSPGRLTLAPDEDIVHIAKKYHGWLVPDYFERAGVKVENFTVDSVNRYVRIKYDSNYKTWISDAIYWIVTGLGWFSNEVIEAARDSWTWNRPIYLPFLFK